MLKFKGLKIDLSAKPRRFLLGNQEVPSSVWMPALPATAVRRGADWPASDLGLDIKARAYRYSDQFSLGRVTGSFISRGIGFTFRTADGATIEGGFSHSRETGKKAVMIEYHSTFSWP
ncbi:MAG TPA: hypothetical protein PLW99_03000 [Candidatus Paceibacterota bacterium]|nr:hypothetical protein [Candidatus Paceibacterota bacterium]